MQPSGFVRADGSLDMPHLMREWQSFWRKDGHLAAEGFQYRESGPHLMLMAYLQRVVNGGGRIEREYGLGRGAVDLFIEWKGARHAVEIKLRRDAETESEGAEQLARYLDTLGEAEGWLVLFDLRSGRRWEERIWNKELVAAGKVVHVVGVEGKEAHGCMSLSPRSGDKWSEGSCLSPGAASWPAHLLRVVLPASQVLGGSSAAVQKDLGFWSLALRCRQDDMAARSLLRCSRADP